MNKKLKIIGVLLIVIILIVTVLITTVMGAWYYLLKKKESNPTISGKKDDWVYSSQSKNNNWFSKIIPKTSGVNLSSVYESSESILSEAASSSVSDSFVGKSMNSDATLGYSVGGSKNIENFRQNIKNGYFPISTDITYNGLFYDYYFNTGKTKESNELFSPSYSTAISKDPISSQTEYYMTVGLNSNIKISDFKRKKQNIMIVLDISGSMSSPLNSYYYDEDEGEKEEEIKSKMRLANEAVNLMIDELKEDDRFGIVLFDDSSYLAKPMNLVKDTNIEKIKEHVLEITEQGGTNFEAGYTKATESFSKKILSDSEYDNRIIVITDAMPNLGKTSKKGLSEYIEKNAANKIYTTFIGVGVDFNTEVIQELSNVRGSNYYSVSSNEQFRKILGEDFDFMLTPLVFDLNLKFESDSYELEEVYGTDKANKTTGNIINVNTLFPSKTDSQNGSKGGVILLKLKKKDNESDGKIKLNVTYMDTNEKKYTNSEEIQFTDNNEFYENTGIRKSIALVRYANCLKNWILFERTEKNNKFIINEQTGITDCIYTRESIYNMLGINERKSVKLSVSEEYKEIFKIIKNYIENEKNELKDDDLKQEIELLDILNNY